jgi:hypothetical protein
LRKVIIPKNVKPIKIWRSRTEPANWLNIHPVNIGRACNGQVHQAGGYLWSYIGNKPRIFPHQGGVAVIQYNKNGKIIKEYSSAKEAGTPLLSAFTRYCNDLITSACSLRARNLFKTLYCAVKYL